jgi:hypothetical protein
VGTEGQAVGGWAPRDRQWEGGHRGTGSGRVGTEGQAVGGWAPRDRQWEGDIVARLPPREGVCLGWRA